MKLQDIIPNPKQPRKDFNQEQLQELADNIKTVGLKEPIEVRPLEDDKKYQIVDGERRYRACKLIPLEDVPVRIREDVKTEEDAAIQSFIINDQRSSYTAQDKETWIYSLYTTSGLSIRKLADKLGVHHSAIDHYLEAYRFRQKIPAYLDRHSFPLTHTALRLTAMVKDDSVRVGLLKMIHEKKLKQDYDTISKASKLLVDAPREAQEAFYLGLVSLGELEDILRFHNKQTNNYFLRGVFTEDIPRDLKKDILDNFPYVNAAVIPKLEDDIIEWEKENMKEYINNYIAQHPERSKKDILHHFRIQTYGWKDEWREFMQWKLKELKTKWKDEAERKDLWRKIMRWLGSLKWINGTRDIEDQQDLRIDVIDLMIDYDVIKQLREYENTREFENGVDELEEPLTPLEEE
jgi:ParB/RepB/Spo0J family partition protein